MTSWEETLRPDHLSDWDRDDSVPPGDSQSQLSGCLEVRLFMKESSLSPGSVITLLENDLSGKTGSSLCETVWDRSLLETRIRCRELPDEEAVQALKLLERVNQPRGGEVMGKRTNKKGNHKEVKSRPTKIQRTRALREGH